MRASGLDLAGFEVGQCFGVGALRTAQGFERADGLVGCGIGLLRELGRTRREGEEGA